jgi:hypothetical protein
VGCDDEAGRGQDDVLEHVLPGDEADDAALIYDPASGRRYPIARAAFVGADLDVAGWSTPWVLVAPS